MNGCGGESITVEVSGGDDYDDLVTQAIRRVSEFLPGCAIQRCAGDCGGLGGMADTKEWYIGCAHSKVTPGGTAIAGTFTFLRHGSEAF